MIPYTKMLSKIKLIDMSKLPRKTKQWAKETIGAVKNAIKILEEQQQEDDKYNHLLKLAPEIACMNRGIKDKLLKGNVNKFVFDNLEDELKRVDEDEEIDYEISFLLCYLDAHIFLDFITENKSDEIMNYIIENLEIPKLS